MFDFITVDRLLVAFFVILGLGIFVFNHACNLGVQRRILVYLAEKTRPSDFDLQKDFCSRDGYATRFFIVMDQMRRRGLIKEETIGGIKYVELTDAGRQKVFSLRQRR